MSNESLPPFFPSSGPGGQCPPGTSQPTARPGQPPLPPSPPATPSHRAQRCFSLSLFVGCGHRGLCSGAPRQVSGPGPCSTRSPHTARPPLLPSLSCFNRTLGPPQPSALSSAFLRCLPNPCPSDLLSCDSCSLDFSSLFLVLCPLPSSFCLPSVVPCFLSC